MTERPSPVLQKTDAIVLVGTMAIYASQADASEGIPRQWRSFLAAHPGLDSTCSFYGCSPCTSDQKIHYLTGTTQPGTPLIENDMFVSIEAGEYAVVIVEDARLLRETWIWLLGSWLANSGRSERQTPEFERYAGISETGTPLGAVEIWIPLEPLDKDVVS